MFDGPHDILCHNERQQVVPIHICLPSSALHQPFVYFTASHTDKSEGIFCRFSDGYYAGEMLELHHRAQRLGSPAIAAHCRLQIFLKSTAAIHSDADIAVLERMWAACQLNRAGSRAPAKFWMQTLASGYEHIKDEPLMDKLLPGVPEPDWLDWLKLQAKLNCPEESSLDDDHLLKMHAAVGKDLVPLAYLADRDVNILLLAEEVMMRKRNATPTGYALQSFNACLLHKTPYLQRKLKSAVSRLTNVGQC